MPKLEQIERMLDADPEDLFLNYARGMALMTAGRPTDAATQLERVIQLDSTYVPAYFQGGQALAQAGNVEAAKELLRKGIVVAAQRGDPHAEAEMTAFLDSL